MPDRVFYRIRIPGKPGSKQSVRVAMKEKEELNESGELKKKFKIHAYQDNKLIQLEKRYLAYAMVQMRQQKYKLVGKARIHVVKLWYVFPPSQKTIKEWSPNEYEFYKKEGWIWNDKKPDLSDNLQKPLFDSLSNLIYQNDCHVVAIDGLRKLYAPREFVGIDMEFYVCDELPSPNFMNTVKDWFK